MDNLTLVIRVNDFTGQVEDGYLALTTAVKARRAGGTTPVNVIERMAGAMDVGEYIALNPKTPVEVLRV